VGRFPVWVPKISSSELKPFSSIHLRSNVDDSPGANGLAAGPALGRGRPRIAGKEVELDGATDARSRQLPVARSGPRGEGLAVLAESETTVDVSQDRSVEFVEPVRPAGQPPLARVLLGGLAVGRVHEVAAKPLRWRWRGWCHDERDEPSHRLHR
jgi:hypothetical protein